MNWTFKNKLKLNFNQNSNRFIQWNVIENVVYKMSAILCQPHCVDRLSSTAWSNFIITVPADGLAPDGVRPSASTVLDFWLSHDFFIVSEAIKDLEYVFTDYWKWPMLWNIQEQKTSVMLSHWGWDKMAPIFADDISYDFLKTSSPMKTVEFWTKFHWTMFPSV